MDYRLIAYVTASTVLIPLVLAIVQWKKIPNDISMLRWILIASFIADIGCISMALNGIANHWVGDLYMFIQFTLLLYIFSRQFTRKILFVVSAALIVVVYLAGILFVGDPISEQLRSGAIDSLILTVVSIAFFYKLLNELKVVNIHRLPILWIAFATLFYYSGNLFVFVASNYLEKDFESFMFTWTVHNILNVIKNILFAIALWQSYIIVRRVNE